MGHKGKSMTYILYLVWHLAMFNSEPVALLVVELCLSPHISQLFSQSVVTLKFINFNKNFLRITFCA